MAWNTSKSSGDIIASSDYNARTDFMTALSSNRSWATISGATDISWDGTQFDGSGIKWDDGTQKWLAVNVVAAGGGINNVVEDTSPQLGGDLDGQSTYGIYDTTYISSTAYSGAKLAGGLLGTGDTQAASGSHTHTQYDSLGEISWTTPTEGIGITLDGTTGMVSGALTIKVDGYIASSTAISKFAPSSKVSGWDSITASGTKYSLVYTWYSESSSKISAYVASGDEYSTAYTERGSQIAGDGLFWDGSNLDVGGYSTISSNAKIGADSVASGNEYTWAYNWINQSGSQLSDFLASGDEYSTSYSERGSQIAGLGLTWNGSELDINDYIASSVATSRFADSSNYSTHKGDSTIHFTEASISHDSIADVSADDHHAGFIGLEDDSTTTITPAADDRIEVSGQGGIYTKAGTSRIYISASATLRQAGGGGGGAENWDYISDGTGITGLGSNQYRVSGTAGDTTIGILGYSTISSQAKSGYDWTSNSGSRYEDILASGVQYSNIVSSGNEYSAAYAHSQDNTQAHSDYLVNNANDTTTGKLTSDGGFWTTTSISGASISGSNLRIGAGGTNITGILDEDNLSSDSDTSLATQQSIRAYVDAVGDTPANWGTLDEGTGITPITKVGVSGTAGDQTISVLGYSTISSNAQKGQSSGAIAMYKIIHGDDITWDSAAFDSSGIQWDHASQEWVAMASSAGADTNTVLTIATASGVASTVTVRHDGTAGTLYLKDIPQNILKSGSSYWQGYLSGQKVIYQAESDLTSVLNDNYPGSSNVNRNYLDNISGNAKSGQSSQYWLLQSGSSYSHTNFIASSVAIGRFADSSNVNWTKITAISSGFDGRLDALEGASYIDTSGTPADDDFAKFTDADTIEGRSYSETRSDLGIQELLDSGTKYTNAYTWYNASANALSQIHASGEEYSSAYASAQALKIHSFHALISGGYLESGSEYAKAYASAQIAYYTDAHVDHDQTTNFVSDEHIDHTGVDITAGAGLTGGGSIDSTRTLDVGAGTGIAVNTDDIEVMGYSAISSNAKAGADYVSSGNEYSAAYDWYTESSSKISDFVASGEEYSAAYTHSQDNTQAHSDYLLNNSDDSTTGTLTAKSFSGPLSGTNLSGGTIQFTTFASATDATAAELEELTDGSETTLHSHAGGGGTTSTFEFINAGTGLGGWTDDTYGVSSSAGSAMSPEVLGYSTISSNAQWSQNWLNVSGSQISSIIGSGNEYSQAYASAQIALYGVSTSNIGGLSDVTSSNPKSGQVLVYGADETNTTWQNQLPALNFSIANVYISAQQNINLTRFDAGSKNVYIWQSAACNSGGSTEGNLQIELLSGSTSVYSTSSATIQQGYPLAKSDGGDTEIRFMYSGTSAVTGEHYGTAFMQVSVY